MSDYPSLRGRPRRQRRPGGHDTGRRSTSCARSIATSGTPSTAPGYWVLTRFDDILEAFQYPTTFCNHSIVATDPDPAYRFLPSFIDPPEHMKYRQADEPVVRTRRRSPGCSPRSSGWRARRSTRSPARAAATSCRRSATSSRSRPSCFSIGLPQDTGPDFFMSCVHRMSGRLRRHGREGRRGDDGRPGATIANYWKDILAERRARPGDPESDLVTHHAARDRRAAAARRRDPRPLRHADARQPRHAQEPARLVLLPPGHARPRTAAARRVARSSSRPRSRSSCAPTRSSAWPARSPRTSTSTAAR